MAMKLRTRLRNLFRGERRYLWNYAALIGVIAALIAAEIYHVLPQDNEESHTVSCPDLIQGCRFVIGTRDIELRFSAPPSGLHPFTLRLYAPAAKTVHASFTMRGMDMGFNRYRLLSGRAGNWHAQVLLPACVTGRRDWLLTLTLDEVRVEIPFSA